MKRWTALIGAIATLVVAVVLVTPFGASAGPPSKTPTISTTLRVSHDCTFTVTGRWSGYPAPAYENEIVNEVYVDNVSVYTDVDITSATHGSFKSVFSGSTDTTAHTIKADTAIHLEGGVDVSAPVSIENVYCH
jgi:hypothetical protein